MENVLEVKKPTFDEEITVDFPKDITVTHNLDKLKTFADKLVHYYTKVVITDVEEVTKERTRINKFLKEVENIRKETVSEFKQPIDDFEKTAKEVEGLLKGISTMMTQIIDNEKAKKRQEKLQKEILPYINNKINAYFVKGYLIDINSIVINEKWFNKTTTNATIFNEIDEQLDNIIQEIERERKDLEVINTVMDTLNVENKELYIQQYNFTKDVSAVVAKIENDIKIKNAQKATSVPEKTVTQETPLETVTFKGTKAMCDQLRSYAKTLGMEECYGN